MSPQGRAFKVGLVGAGYVSAYHIRALSSLENVTIVGIADRELGRAQQLAKQFNIPTAFCSLREMQRTSPDVIHILTPPDSHCELSLEALNMGCHVFVEKPMAPTADECDRMILHARQVGKVLSVNHSARMDPVIVKALDLVRQGACGDILSVDFLRSSDYPPYAGGPVPPHYRNGSYPFQDLGVHGLTLLEAFLGSIQGLDVHPISTGKDPHLFFDEWHALVKCANGTGRMYLSWNVKMPRNELIIHGTRGILNVDCYLQNCILRKTLPGPKVVSLFWAAGTSSLSTLKGALATGIGFATGKVRPNPGIHNSVREFYRALTADSVPPITAQEGRSMIYWMEDVCRRTDAEKRARLAVSAPVPPGRILVTGAAGFVGKALVKRLIEQGERVRVLIHRPNPALESDPSIDVVYGDLGDPVAVDRAVAGIELVYHVGATMRGSWPEFECGTVRGTQNIVDSCLRHNVKRLVYVSSVTVLDYAQMSPKDIVTEGSSLEPYPERRGSYTQSKLAAERIVKEAIGDRQLPAVILRPGQIFGPGAEKVPPFGTVAIGGRWLVIGSGNLRLPLVYIDDLVDGILSAAIRDGVCGSTFQIVDGTEVTQRQYIDHTQIGHPISVSYGSRILLQGVAILLEGLGKLMRRNVPLTRYKLQSITAPAAFDCSAAVKGLGWTPRIGAQQGLTATFRDSRPKTMVAAAH